MEISVRSMNDIGVAMSVELSSHMEVAKAFVDV